MAESVVFGTYIPLYSLGPYTPTELDLIMAELEEWLSDPSGFMDKQLSGRTKYL